MTAQSLINAVYQLIGLPANTPIPALASGAGQGAETITANDSMLAMINQAQSEMARLFVPIRDVATITVGAGATFPPYASVVSVAGRQIRAMISLKVGAYELIDGRSGDFASWYSRGYAYDPQTKAPLAWADLGAGVELSIPPVQSTAFVATGYCLPVPVAVVGDSIDAYMSSSDLVRCAEYWIAAQIAMRSTDNPDLAPRGTLWMSQFQALAQSQYEQLISGDSTLSAYFPPLPQIATSPIVARQQAAVI